MSFFDARKASRLALQRASTFAAFCLLFIAVSIAAAQTTSLQGTIADTKGGMIAHATVTARNEATGKIATVAADTQGHFTFASLADGLYDVSASAPGFQLTTRKAVQTPAMSRSPCPSRRPPQTSPSTPTPRTPSPPPSRLWTLCSLKLRLVQRSPRP